jgi:hypothetical protein
VKRKIMRGGFGRPSVIASVTAVLVRPGERLPESQRLFSSSSSSLQPSEQPARQKEPDRFVERKCPVLIATSPARRLLKEAKAAFGAK